MWKTREGQIGEERKIAEKNLNDEADRGGGFVYQEVVHPEEGNRALMAMNGWLKKTCRGRRRGKEGPAVFGYLEGRGLLEGRPR